MLSIVLAAFVILVIAFTLLARKHILTATDPRSAIEDFLVYADTIEFKSLTQGKDPRPEHLSQLNTIKLKASNILAAIERCENKTDIEFTRTTLSGSAQHQYHQDLKEGFHLMRAWAESAIEAADAILKLQDLRARGLPCDIANKHLHATSIAFAKSQDLILAADALEGQAPLPWSWM